MQTTSIFFPVLVLVFWTLIVLTLIPITRVGAARRGQVTAGDFRYGESSSVPPRVSLPNRNYMNLLELPVLFYVVCVVSYEAGLVSPVAINLAWAFVALRVIHSVIHLTYNNVVHRLVAFGLGNAVLAMLLVHTALALGSR